MRCAAISKFLRMHVLFLSLGACIPTLPQPDAQDRAARLASYQQNERAIALLPGVQRVAVTATAAVITVDGNANTSTILDDVARVTGLPTSAIVVRAEPATINLLRMGPWTVAATSRWPLIGTAIALLALFASGAGYLAWRLRPRSSH